MPTSYDDLVRDVPIWLYAQNRDIVAEMPQLISDAEDQIFELIDHDLFQTYMTPVNVTPSNPVIDLSGQDVLEVRDLTLKIRDGLEVPLERRNQQFLKMMYGGKRPDIPRFYADHGDVDIVKVYPTPRDTYEVTPFTNVMPVKLAIDNQTNRLSERYPRVYERAVMRQGAIFMKNPQDAATYLQEMTDAVNEANMSIARHRRDETGVRERETANRAGS